MEHKKSARKPKAGARAGKLAAGKRGDLPAQARALVLQTMAEAVTCTDARGVIRYTNAACERIFGYAPGELLGQSISVLNAAPPRENARLLARISKAVSGGKTWEGNLLNRRRDGSLIHTRGRVVAMARAGRICAAWVHEDVTERKRAEEALRVQTERLLIGQRAAGLIVVDWDIVRDEFSWSDSAERLRGPLPPGGKYPLYIDQIHPEDREQFLATRAEAVNTLRGRTEQYRIVRTDGRVLSVETQQVVFPGAEGKAARMVIALHDVTERKRLEAALQAQTERLLIGQRAANMIVMDWDIVNDEVTWSDASDWLRGPLPPGGKYPTYAEQVHPEDRKRFLARRAEVIRTLQGRRDQYRFVRTDGRVIWVETEQVLFPGDDGKAARMVIALHDVTERKLAEESLHRLNEELEVRVAERTRSLAAARDEAERASRAKSDFLASMSHELRTPLNTILGFTDILKADLEPKLDGRQTEIFGLVQKAGWHLLNLINQVLDLENVEAGALELSMDRVGLDAMLAECVDFMRPQAEERQVVISLDRKSGAALAVFADRTRLRQALLNLLSNAVKYNVPQGRVEVACRLTRRGRVQISVKDSGPGLSAEQQAQLYQPFNRLGREGTMHGGAGIGLMLTRRLVELMDGRVGVDSAPGAGSTFWLEFARQPLGPPRDARRKPRVAADSSTTPGLRTALYVDDNPDCILLVEHILGRDKGLRLLTAETGEQGLELARAQQPDLIILDIQLPGIDGYEVLRRLREDALTRDIPTIAFSADALPDHVKRGKAAGFDNYLPKPIQASAFVDAVHRALKGRQG